MARRRLLSVTLKLGDSDDKGRAGAPLEPLSRAVRSSLRRENKKLLEENEKLRQDIAKREGSLGDMQEKIKMMFVWGAHEAM